MSQSPKRILLNEFNVLSEIMKEHAARTADRIIEEQEPYNKLYKFLRESGNENGHVVPENEAENATGSFTDWVRYNVVKIMGRGPDGEEFAEKIEEIKERKGEK